MCGTRGVCVQAILEDLHDSRQAQQAAKVAQQAHMAAHEKAEFERILRVNQEKEAQERSLAEQVCAPRHHLNYLLKDTGAKGQVRADSATLRLHYTVPCMSSQSAW